MKMMHDLATCIAEELVARVPHRRRRHLDEVEPLAEMNGTPASPAIDRASSVFPVPGVTSRMPRGIRPPMNRRARILQELDDLTHLVLRFVDAGNVRKRHDAVSGSIVLVHQRRHAANHHANEDETRHSEQQKPTATAPYRPALNDCA